MPDRKSDDTDTTRPETLSEREARAFLQSFEECETDVKEMQSILEPYTDARLAQLAGPHFEAMSSSRQSTLLLLSDPNPHVRNAALQFAYRHWAMSDVGFIYERMALDDPDDDVRETAIRALGTAFANSKDSRIGRALANLVKNHQLRESARLTAFASLIRLHGVADYLGPSPIVATSLAEVDWELVESYFAFDE